MAILGSGDGSGLPRYRNFMQNMHTFMHAQAQP
jgi:hypothetical protein